MYGKSQNAKMCHGAHIYISILPLSTYIHTYIHGWTKNDLHLILFLFLFLLISNLAKVYVLLRFMLLLLYLHVVAEGGCKLLGGVFCEINHLRGHWELM